jgi:hypothetical protein
MRLEVQVVNPASASLRRIANTNLPEARRKMVDHGMRTALESTIELNPVRTGRSRAAWVAALAKLGGTAAGGATSGPVSEGAALGSAAIEQTQTTTAASATNSVRYVPFLEYGTSKRAPVAMARRSLAAVQEIIGGWFRLS